ncbi:SPOR domain-containing protein [Methylibium rhizosphaerae]|uniref:SPOR domain-containing protein n=1 Tax=Methylibium rhizosphaerae TaxID=2570323 RepID=UPI00112B2EFB|nr:SPOR domain-containing protein [Methylibium rhizosphaerae]
MKSQRGGFFVGMIVGLLVGLALALAVALYVTKVPVPFVNKVPQRTAEQDAAEAEKNKNWDPNAPLAGKTPAKPAAPAPAAASGPSAPTPANGTAARPAPAFAPAAGVNANAPAQARDPAPAAAAATPATQAAASDAFVYFVQAGAFARTEEAEQQRAKLAMLGLEARITERDQAGKTIYRVRVGPYDKRTDAEAVKEKLDTSGAGDSALVRVQRP